MSVSLERYYRLHARIYDATRWSFLFGRTQLIKQIARHINPVRILEIGCGTGKNLAALSKQFPDAELTGVDLSKDMLKRAEKRLSGCGKKAAFIHRVYSRPLHPKASFDLIVFSYTLSMINPGCRQAIQNARRDLLPGGMIAVVDFCDSAVAPFKSWMKINHVRMDGHLPVELRKQFRPVCDEKMTAYGGLWQYLIFIGKQSERKGGTK
ncbi:MAG: methyltransferase domain-containing protein [Desulfosalsimonadaceae bacterium]